MKTATPGTTVKLTYTICLQDGTRLRPLHAGDTLEFTLGRGSVLPGFERAVLGMSEGETRKVKVPSAEAYGPYRDERVFTLRRSQVLSQVEPLKIGNVVRVGSADEGEFFAAIREVRADEILLDANHPLCGQDITFEIHLLEAAAADPSPLREGTEAAQVRKGALHAARS